MNIIASIHDKWLQKIASGEKTIEVRKSTPMKISHLLNVHGNKFYIFWYNTKIKSIVGYSEFDNVCCKINLNLEKSLEMKIVLLDSACLGYEASLEYQGKSNGIYLWWLGKYTTLETPLKIPQGKRAPQSWCYFDTIFPDKEGMI